MTTSGKSSREHAVLSPSSAERWIACPGSVRLSQQLPSGSSESSYALEGTCAHSLGEIRARIAFGLITPAEGVREINRWRKFWQKKIGLTEAMEEEMETHIAGYVALLQDKFEENPNTSILLEQRVPSGIPSCWGTSDAVLVSPIHVEAVDLKYGAGVFVPAEGNPQLRIYGVGTLEAFGDLLGDTEWVRTTIYQPRMDNVSSETVTADELRAWRDSIIPVAELALGDDAPFNPGEEQCRWCPASGQCAAQLEWATALDFGTPPEQLTNEEIADAMERIPMIMQWCEAVRSISFEKIYNERENVPGFKVVRSGGKRSIPDSEAAIDHLVSVGYLLDQVSTRKVRGIGELEKLMGKPKFNTELEDYIKKGEGSLSVVPEDDPRPSVDAAAEAKKEFSE